MGTHSLQLSCTASCLCRLCRQWNRRARGIANNGCAFSAAVLRSGLFLKVMLVVDAASVPGPSPDSDLPCHLRAFLHRQWRSWHC